MYKTGLQTWRVTAALCSPHARLFLKLTKCRPCTKADGPFSKDRDPWKGKRDAWVLARDRKKLSSSRVSLVLACPWLSRSGSTAVASGQSRGATRLLQLTFSCCFPDVRSNENTDRTKNRVAERLSRPSHVSLRMTLNFSIFYIIRHHFIFIF